MPAPPESPAPRPPPDDLDDVLSDLPPMDGGLEDDEEAAPEELDEPEEPTDPSDDGTDTGENDPVDTDELQAEGGESGWLDDAGEVLDLDVGSIALDVGDETDVLTRDAEAADGIAGDDGLSEIDELEGAPVADSGEEGFDQEEDEAFDDLGPSVDAGEDDDAEADLGLGDLVPGLGGGDELEEPRPPFGGRSWERAGAPVQLQGAVDAVACVARGVLVAGDGLTRVDLEGGAESISGEGSTEFARGELRALHAAGPLLVAESATRGLLVSSDGGRTFADANGWRAALAAADSVAPTDMAVAAGALGVVSAAGQLAVSTDAGSTWARVEGRRVRALASDGEALTVLAEDAEGAFLGQVAIAGGAAEIRWRALASALPALGPDLRLVAAGAEVAVWSSARGVRRLLAPGLPEETWARLPGSLGTTACAFVSAGAGPQLMVALHSASEERAWLALAEGASLRIVAELGETTGEEDGARVLSLVWDAAHGVAWAAGAFGLVAFHPSQVWVAEKTQ